MTNPTIVYPVKMEHGWNFSIPGLKMMVKSEVDFFFWIPLCISHFLLEEKLRNILAETIKSTCFDQDDNVSVATTNVTNSILEEIEEFSDDDDFESE